MGLTKLPFDATSRTSSTQLWALIVEENASSQMAARPPRGEKVDFMLFFVQVRRVQRSVLARWRGQVVRVDELIRGCEIFTEEMRTK
jgi:hypothetical protein